MLKIKKKIKLNNNKYIVTPFKVNAGIYAVSILAPVIESIAPYLVNAQLNDNKLYKVIYISKMLTDNPELADALMQIGELWVMENGYDIELSSISFPEYLKLIVAIARVNEWDKLWNISAQLRIVKLNQSVMWGVSNLTALFKLKRK